MTSLTKKNEQDRFEAYKLHQQGVVHWRIALKFKRTLKWVTRTIKRFQETGGFKDRPREGRPSKIKPRDRVRLVKAVKGKRGQSLRKTVRSFKTAKGEKIGRETLRKSLRLAKLYPHRRRKVTALTAAQKIRRVAFAKKYRRFDWTKCAFWDETEFELNSTPNLKNDITWDEKGVSFNYEKRAHPPKFKFGAAITVNGPTRIVPYTGTIDQVKYREMVDKVIPDINKLLKGVEWTFIQDGARPHTAKDTITHLTSKVPHLFPKADWPANSPDDNAAENVFGYIEGEIGPKNIQTIEALEKEVRKVWSNLTPEYCRKCIEALPARLKQIIETNGEYVYEVKKSK